MTVLKTFDFGAARTNKSWAWDKLTDGQIHKMVKGTDYTAKYAAAQIRVYAKAHNLKVRVSGGNPTDDHVVLQFEKAPKAKSTGKKASKKTATETPVAKS